MSVRPTSFDNPDAWEYVHDDAPGGSHGGTLDPATVTYATNPDGTANEMIVNVPCPQCGAMSSWPPGGGADALYGQMLHVQMAMRPPDGAASRGASKTAQDAAAEVKERVIATDGEERWVLDDQVLAQLQKASA